MLTLSEVREINQVAKEKAKTLDIPVCIAIVGYSQELMFLERHENANPITAEVAQSKAKTSLLFRGNTKSISSTIGEMELLAEGVANLGKGVIFSAGGVPVEKEGVVVGGIGVSGGSPEEDHEIASTGANAVIK